MDMKVYRKVKCPVCENDVSKYCQFCGSNLENCVERNETEQLSSVEVDDAINAFVTNAIQWNSGSVNEVVVSKFEKLMLSKALLTCGNNQVQAAQLLGINRNTLRSKMQKYGFFE